MKVKSILEKKLEIKKLELELLEMDNSEIIPEIEEKNDPPLLKNTTLSIPLQKKIITLYNIVDYIRFRKIAKRKDLHDYFVKSKKMTEGQLDLRLKRAMENKSILRADDMKTGYYKCNEKN